MPIVVAILGIALIVGAGAYFLREEEVVPPAAESEIVTPTPLPNDGQMIPEENSQATDTTSETAVLETVPDTSTVTETIAPEEGATKEPVKPVVVEADTYKDGTYTVTTSYIAPSRSTHDVEVTFTIKDDKVTAADVSYGGDLSVQASNFNQEKFSAAYKTLVIGKELDGISLSRVGGASLTTNAFNEALAKIKTDAQS